MTESAPTPPPDAREDQTAPSGSPLSRGGFFSRLSRPVDSASLVVFRIVFGALMVWEMARFQANEYIRAVWVDPAFHFTYYGFSWVQPWPGDGVYWHCLVVALCAAGIALGLFYRASCAIFTLGWTYLFLLEEARYVNHFYLIGLIGFLLMLVPAHRAFSLDALRKQNLRSRTAPTWSLWLLRAQVGIVYTYSGIAKLDPDWLQGEPLREVLSGKTHWPLLGRFAYEEWVVYAFSYGALVPTLFAVPLLLWKRSRPWIFTLLLLFHLTNGMLFKIGVFPVFAIAATTLFFEPDWPRRLLGRFRKRDAHDAPETLEPPAASEPLPGRVLSAVILVYLAIQLLVPFRHFLYPGNLQWTEEGQMFSWHLKSRAKESSTRFLIKSAGREDVWEINPLDYLTRWQYGKMKARPDMILQFAHYLAAQLEAQDYRDVEVRALVRASLNRRPRQLLLDPSVDLSSISRSWRHDDWIIPLKASLPKRVYLDRQKEESPQ